MWGIGIEYLWCGGINNSRHLIGWFTIARILEPSRILRFVWFISLFNRLTLLTHRGRRNQRSEVWRYGKPVELNKTMRDKVRHRVTYARNLHWTFHFPGQANSAAAVCAVVLLLDVLLYKRRVSGMIYVRLSTLLFVMSLVVGLSYCNHV